MRVEFRNKTGNNSQLKVERSRFVMCERARKGHAVVGCAPVRPTCCRDDVEDVEPPITTTLSGHVLLGSTLSTPRVCGEAPESVRSFRYSVIMPSKLRFREHHEHPRNGAGDHPSSCPIETGDIPLINRSVTTQRRMA
jgi:hypothetical protein